MNPWDLCSVVSPGRQVVIAARGAYHGMFGTVIKQLSPPVTEDSEAITGQCRYALDLGFRDAEGNVNACDFRRREFRVIAIERPRRGTRRPA